MTAVLWRYVEKDNVESVMVFVNGVPKTVPGENPHFDDIIRACSDNDAETVARLVDKALAIKVHSGGLFEVIDGVVHVKGEPCPEALSDRIIKFTERNLDVTPLVRFYERLLKNPSKRALDSLYRYLEANNTPIVADEIDGVDYTGCFVAWKSVRRDFKDCHSGTFDNSPGCVVNMPRNQVDEDPDRTCSHGLHVAAWEYAWGFTGGRKMKVYVDPANVVAVPRDYNDQKMRVCEYFVVEEVLNACHVNEEELKLVEGDLTARKHSLASLEEDDDYDDWEDDEDWY